MTQRERDRLARELAIQMLERYEECQFSSSKSSIPKEDNSGAKYKIKTPTLIANIEFVVDFESALDDPDLIEKANLIIEDLDEITSPKYYDDLVLIGKQLKRKRFTSY